MNTTPRRTGISLPDLMAQQSATGKAFLAAEIVQKTNRQHGPVDGHCEVCGQAAAQFILQDWMNWHCIPCVERIVRAEYEDALAMAA
jgi:hypothetical protein